MNCELIERKKKEVVENFGSWTAHNICLGDNVYTIADRIVGDEIRLRRIVQVVSDIADGNLSNLRVLDLACLEGMYGIELARRGANVVAIEGRKANIEKARFVQNALEIKTLELVHADVRSLSLESYGSFDAVLCLGILYHLDAPDVFRFTQRIFDVCNKVAILDTNISLRPIEARSFENHIYWGRATREHRFTATTEEKAAALWKSLDNLTSFTLTRASLYNRLSHVGFTSVYECFNPPEVNRAKDRVMLLAVKGHQQNLTCSHRLNQHQSEDWPERRSRFGSHTMLRALYRLGGFLPDQAKNSLKKILKY